MEWEEGAPEHALAHSQTFRSDRDQGDPGAAADAAAPVPNFAEDAVTEAEGPEGPEDPAVWTETQVRSGV